MRNHIQNHKKLVCLMLAVAMTFATACGTRDASVAVAAPETVATEPVSSVEKATVEPEEEQAEPEELSEVVAVEVPTDAEAYTAEIDHTTIDPSIYLDYSAGIDAGVYKWVLDETETFYVLTALDENGEPVSMNEAAINVGSGAGPEDGNFPAPDGAPAGEFGGPGGPGGASGTVYQGVYINANITNVQYQTMLIYVPKDYLTTDEGGNVTGINYEATVNGYTAKTAPIVYWNECGGWRSSQPGACDTSYIEAGMIYVAAGARSRDATAEDGIKSGKAPTQIVDLKSGVIQLRANRDVIPGNTDCIVSGGGSGAGEMSSVLGASGNMPEYYEYMYQSGTLGVTQNEDGSYSSVFPDDIYGAQCYCPIADLENADLAYAWWWCDLTGAGGEKYGNSTFSDFELRLQELEAEAFVAYINGLNLKDSDGNALTLTGLRSGSYYDSVLRNLSDALNAAVVAGNIDPENSYSNQDTWLAQNEDGTWQVTDLKGFMVGTGLVNSRGKDIPGFDTFGLTAENDAFGYSDVRAVHYSKSVAAVLEANYEELSQLDGFADADVDEYISQALYSEESTYISHQVNLMNATEILLGNDGFMSVDPAPFWRVRSGTSDQHTSFTIGYNLCLAAEMAGLDSDYHLVWNMGHGNSEGTSTGTFVEWIQEICTP